MCGTQSRLGETAEIIMVERGPFLGISEDIEGNIWVGGGVGAWRYDGRTMSYYPGVQAND